MVAGYQHKCIVKLPKRRDGIHQLGVCIVNTEQSLTAVSCLGVNRSDLLIREPELTTGELREVRVVPPFA